MKKLLMLLLLCFAVCLSGCAKDDGYAVIEIDQEEMLREFLAEKGITSYRLGKMVFPASTYYSMKRGDNISTHTLNQLCKLLGCRVEDILEYVEED